MKAFPLTILALVASAEVVRAEEIIDLQWAICASQPASIARVLDLEEKSSASVTYYENVEKSLRNLGVSLKTKTKRNKIKSEVKLSTDELPALNDVHCETDRYGSRFFRRCTMENETSSDSIWSRAQLHFIRGRVPKFSPQDLVAFGPYPERQWEGDYDDDVEFSLDAVTVPGLGAITELSAKVDEEDADELYEEISLLLAKKEIPLCPQQEGKADRIFRSLP